MTGVRDRVEVAFGLGSNLGDKPRTIERALTAMEAAGIAFDLRRSSLFRTEPWGPVQQDWYVNACAIGKTALQPADLLVRVKALEVALGRVETIRWGPRVIDIDILYYGDVSLASERLTLPHPGLLERPFVLIPLAELRPELSVGGQRIADRAARADRAGVVRLDETGNN